MAKEKREAGVWKERAYLAGSIFFCTLAVVLGTLLYPFVLLFFGAIACFYLLFRRGGTAGSASRGNPRGAIGA